MESTTPTNRTRTHTCTTRTGYPGTVDQFISDLDARIAAREQAIRRDMQTLMALIARNSHLLHD
jgi:N-methylhydantoinase B/oxoprolinase/acetone carboxylase alpha subunit